MDFWTPEGFIRNTFYNGWNSILPWIAYFLLGMWLGRLNWHNKHTLRNIFLIGTLFFTIFEILRAFARNDYFNEGLTGYIMSEYFPPFIPFMVLTASFGLIVISIAMFISKKFEENKIITFLSITGRMTLTHYVLHLTLGMILLSMITGIEYTGNLQTAQPASAELIFAFAFCFFLLSIALSILWNKYYKYGPIEMAMRKFSE
jgi:uncharacterized membrane protein YeiB